MGLLTTLIGGSDGSGSGASGQGIIAATSKYMASTPHATRTTSAQTLTRLHYLPMWVAERIAIDRIGVEVTTGGAAGSVVRLGLYDTSNGLPGARLLESAALSAESTGLVEATVSVELDPGLYWTAVVSQVAAPQLRMAATMGQMVSVDSAAVIGASANTAHRDSNGITGALPATASPNTAGPLNTAPLMVVRFAPLA